jgi:hypothetical protein
MMPRAQYVGYTATPYANVFVDPSDVEDIFPRDFIVALPRPTDYMGADDFHDFHDDRPFEERPLATSKERAHVRFLSEEPHDDELRQALDMFVLTGAVKVHRERLNQGAHRHHTMLVHEAMGKDVHRDAAVEIARLWRTAGYYSPSGLNRLRDLYMTDVLPVCQALTDLPTPQDFDDLKQDIAEALRLINPADRNASPVIVVNSDKELEKQQESLDFDKRRVWRILVGGNKLARGFTVEGLTVTYYRRATRQVDTLMQMGRWFGFRKGYRDLVRLYTTSDLHSMFAAACLDEEFLRGELRRYSTTVDGGRQITPKQVPPLIAQHRPDLRPTGRNKMWNAKMVEKASPGGSIEPVAYPNTVDATRRNAERWLPVLDRASQTERFAVPEAKTTYDAHVALVAHHELLAVLDSLAWLGHNTFQPELAWLHRLTADQLERWVVLIPQQAGLEKRRTILGRGPFSVFERQRTGTGSFQVFSESRHRNAARRIAGVLGGTSPDPAADRLHEDRTGAVVLYPVVERGTLTGDVDGPIDPGRVTMATFMVTPLSTAPSGEKLIKWVTIDSLNPGAVVVDNPGD